MRKNVASQVVCFQAVSTTDGSAVTAGTPTIYYTIDGGTQGTGAGTSTHEGNGCWSYVPAQAETNGNHVAYTFSLSGAVSQTVNIYPGSYDYTDSVRLGLTALPNAAADAAGGLPVSDAGGLDLDTILDVAISSRLAPTTAGRTLDVTTGGAAGVDWGNVENASTSVDLSATAISLCDTVTTNTDMRGTDNAFLAASAPTNFADLSITATTGRVDVASIEGSDATDQINAACDTAIETYGLQYLVNTALPTNWATNVTANSALDYLADDGTAVYDRTTDSLQAIADAGGGGPTAAQIADAVWDEAQADHVSVGTFGEVATEIAAILVDTGTTLPALLATAQADLDIITGADGVNLLSATQASIDAIEADTNELQGDWANGGRLDLIVDAILVDTGTTIPGILGTPAGADLATDIAANQTDLDAILVDLADGTVQVGVVRDGAIGAAAVADIFSTTTIAEAYAADGAAGTPAQILYQVQQALTEFSIASTTITVKKLDGSTTASTYTIDSATTPTSRTRAT